MDQLELGGMPVRLHACTPTSLTTWLDCPRRYRFTYLDRPRPAKGAPWAHNSLGAAVHNALRDWWELPFAERRPTAAAGLVAAKWVSEGWRDERQQAEWRDLAIGWVGDYLASVDPHDEPIGIERTVALRTTKLALSGRIDRLDERADGLAVVDYKTGRWVPGTDEARSSMALAIYAAAAASTLRRPCTTVELHHLPTGTITIWEHTEQSLQRQLSRAEAIAEEVVAARAALTASGDGDELFPTNATPLCSWCDFRVSCPAGQVASQQISSWAAVATPE